MWLIYWNQFDCGTRQEHAYDDLRVVHSDDVKTKRGWEGELGRFTLLKSCFRSKCDLRFRDFLSFDFVGSARAKRYISLTSRGIQTSKERKKVLRLQRTNIQTRRKWSAARLCLLLYTADAWKRIARINRRKETRSSHVRWVELRCCLQLNKWEQVALTAR